MTLAVAILLSIQGCSGLFFYPDRVLYLTPKTLGLKFSELEIKSSGSEVLRGWIVSSENSNSRSRGTIAFFHGNAQNISAHLPSVAWLAQAGFSIVTIDYRGYGPSDGRATLSGARQDVSDILAFISSDRESFPDPLFALGQSLGAALLLDVACREFSQSRVRAMVIDSAFSSYREIAREKIGSLWLLWPFQYPLSLLISDRYAPILALQQCALPTLFIHGKTDDVVPFWHSEVLFEAAGEPKQLLLVEAASHLDSMKQQEVREKVLNLLR